MRDGTELHPIEYYSIPAMPDTILGPGMISAGDVQVEYFAPEQFNAPQHQWTLSAAMMGESTTSSIWIDFDNEFKEGELGVQSVHPGYGTSEMKTIVITADQTSVNFNATNKPKISWVQYNETISVKAENFIPGTYQLQLFSLDGKSMLEKFFQVNVSSTKTNINLATIPKGTYFLCIVDNSSRYIHKLIVE